MNENEYLTPNKPYFSPFHKCKDVLDEEGTITNEYNNK